MAGGEDGRLKAAGRKTVEDHVLPMARLVLRALALPAAGIAAAGVLLLIGISLLVAATVFLVALLAGAVTVPLAMLAGRRRAARRQSSTFSGNVVDAEATVRVVDKSAEGEQEARRGG